MQNKYSYWTCHNFEDKCEDENEDSIYFQAGSNVHRLAIADGAGGAGIFCKNWSKKLVDSLPESFEAINKDWFISKSKEFYDETQGLLLNKDLFVKEKFVSEGSYSTLLYVWIEQKEKKIYCVGVGDTYLFLFRKKDKSYVPEFVYPNNVTSNIDSNPNLLNWTLTIKDNALCHKEYDIKEYDIIIGCTDSIARWLFMHIYLFNSTSNYFENTPNIEELEMFKNKSCYDSMAKILEFLIHIDNKETFKEFLQEEISKGLLEPDDFTLFIYLV